MTRSDITPIGITNYRNTNKKFGIKDNDQLGRIYCIGKTDVGKSTLLKNMALFDIERDNGSRPESILPLARYGNSTT